MSKKSERSLLPLWSQLFSVLHEPEALRDDPEFRVHSIDVDKIVAKNTRLFLQLRANAKAEANLSRFEAAKKFITTIQEGLRKNISGYKDLANVILTKPEYAQLRPMFRNLDEVSESDNRDILIDVKLLELITELKQQIEGKDDANGTTRS